MSRTAFALRIPGSTRVSRVGERVSGSRTFLQCVRETSCLLCFAAIHRGEVRFGATPKPARVSRASQQGSQILRRPVGSTQVRIAARANTARSAQPKPHLVAGKQINILGASRASGK